MNKKKTRNDSVYLIKLDIDQEKDLLIAKSEELDILKSVKTINKIIISGHSSANGPTLQFDPFPNRNVPTSFRTRHYSEVVSLIAKNLDPSHFSADRPLRISLRSCFGGISGSNSLGAKIQRRFESVHGIHCSVTGRTGFVFIDKPGYVVFEKEYAYQLVKENIKLLLSRQPLKTSTSVLPEHRDLYHKLPHSKVRFYTNPQTLEQWEEDAYANSHKFQQGLRILILELKVVASEMDDETRKLIQDLENQTSSLSGHNTQTLIIQQILPLLCKVRDILPSKSKRLDGSIQYIQKYVISASSPKCIAPAQNITQRPSALSLHEIAELKILGLKIRLEEFRDTNQSIYSDLKNVIELILNYYKYQLKHELSTQQVNLLINEIHLFLSTYTKDIDQDHRAYTHLINIYKLIAEIKDGYSSEGRMRAFRMGGLSGLTQYSLLVKTSKEKRAALCTQIQKALEKNFTAPRISNSRTLILGAATTLLFIYGTLRLLSRNKIPK